MAAEVDHSFLRIRVFSQPFQIRQVGEAFVVVRRQRLHGDVTVDETLVCREPLLCFGAGLVRSGVYILRFDNERDVTEEALRIAVISNCFANTQSPTPARIEST